MNIQEMMQAKYNALYRVAQKYYEEAHPMTPHERKRGGWGYEENMNVAIDYHIDEFMKEYTEE